MSYTTRCNAAERKAFPRDTSRGWRASSEQTGEPALGTLDERLSIILNRLGKSTRPVRMTKDERADYLQWLADESLENVA